MKRHISILLPVLHVLIIASILIPNLTWLAQPSMSAWAASLLDAPVETEAPLETAEPQPSATPITATLPPPVLVETPIPTATPEPPVVEPPSPTPEPTLVIEPPTATPDPKTGPGNGVNDPLTLDLESGSLAVAAGDIITITWSLHGWLGGLTGAELSLIVPAGFLPVEPVLGEFNMSTSTYTLILTESSGSQAWYLTAEAAAPYLVQATVRQNGVAVATRARELVQRGPDRLGREGGEAQGFNGRVRAHFPANALPEAVDLTIRPASLSADAPTPLGGLPLEVIAVSVDSGMEVHQFQTPITLEIAYDESQAGPDESMLTVFYYDEEMLTWRPLGTVVDAENNRLYARTDHLTLFDFKAQNWEAARLPSMAGFQVSGFTGAATYSFAIQTPPGPAGLQPSVSLSYNSQVADSAGSRSQSSWVGMGWSLDTGYIQRSMNGTPDYVEDDTFSLVLNGVGGLLLPITDQDGNSNTVDYHLADENFWRVRQYKATGSVSGYTGDIGYWVIWDKQGNTYFFGNYADGSTGGHAWYPAYPGYEPGNCFAPTMETWRWSLTRAVNNFGQELTYTYYNEMTLPNLSKFKENCSGYLVGMALAVYPAQIIYPHSRYRIVFVRSGTLREDYDHAWDDRQSLVLYQRSLLSQIQVWYDADTTWGNFNEQMIRSYVLGYGQNSQQIMPNNAWQTNGTGKTPTLTSIQEYGLNGTQALPAAEFFYDQLHLVEAHNGYGGTIEYAYNAWGATQGAEAQYCDFPGGGTGIVYPDSYTLYCKDFIAIKKNFQPGGVYQLSITAKWGGGQGNQIRVGLDYGGGIVWGDTFTLSTSYQTYPSSPLTLPAGASQARPVYDCLAPGGCYVNMFKMDPVITRYRVVSKTLSDEVTGGEYTSTYAYGVAAVNDSGHSDLVLHWDKWRLLSDPYSEFRGHSYMIETGPDGRAVQTWYYQDDILKGRAWKVQVRSTSGAVMSESLTTYASKDDSHAEIADLGDLPCPEGEDNEEEEYWQDLHIVWVYTVSQESRVCEGNSACPARQLTRYEYKTSEQGSAQYGNLTRTLESVWNGTAWADYRLTRTLFYPNNQPTGVYLVGLPGITKTYACGVGWVNGQCSDLYPSYPPESWVTGAQWYLYDNHHPAFNTPPTQGKPTGARSLLSCDSSCTSGSQRFTDQVFAYDDWGNRTLTTAYTSEGTYTAMATDGARSSSVAYDNTYNTYPVSETNALLQVTQIGYGDDQCAGYHTGDMLGVPTSVKDPNNVYTYACYDDFGRITAIIRNGDDVNNPTMLFSYHEAVPNPYFTDKPFWTEAKQRVSGSTYFTLRKYYDGLGRAIQTQVVGAVIGDPVATRDLLTDTFYDAYGQVVKQTISYDVATGSNYHVRSTSQYSTQTTYDALGRPLQVLNTAGILASSYAYSLTMLNGVGYLNTQYTQYTDAYGHVSVTNTRNDLWGRTVLVDAPTSSDVSYTYDTRGQLLTATRGGATVSLAYDLGGRKLSMSDPDMGNWDYTYNALGELTYQDDANDKRTCLYYDSLGRVTGKYYYNNTNTACPSNPTSLPVSYTYDSGTYGKGRRTGMIDLSGSTTWYYDARGRVTREDKVIYGAGNFRTTWGYNSADLVSWMKYPENAYNGQGEQVNYTYQPQMVMNTLAGTSTYVSRTAYDAQGRLQLRSLGGMAMSPVISVDYQYFGWGETTGLGRLSGIVSQLPGTPPTVRQNLQYTYDYVGNVLTITDSMAGGTQTQTFTYDALDRLTGAQASGGTGGTYSLQSYVYDNTTGNMTSNAGTAYGYDDPDHAHAVTDLGGVQKYWYDANGNMTTRITTDGTYNLAYDQENRLTGVSGAATAAFTYDGDGNRVKGIVNGVTTAYIGNYYEYSTGVPTVPVAPLNNGVACVDNATGTGYVMYSAESVHTRFAAHPPHADNADHFICVKYDSGWKYDNNSSYYAFTPAEGDILVASINFDTDTITSLVGQNTVYQGIAKGYASGNLVYTADMWGGAANDGEFMISGTNFAPDSDVPTVPVAPLNNGVACIDNATGSGYLMYSAESVHTRFAANPPNVANADHFICVKYDSGWKYDNNSSYYAFTPNEGDILVATVNFDNDTITSLAGQNAIYYGIPRGYASGNLAYIADMYGGAANDGEFTITGTSFVPNKMITARKYYYAGATRVATRENGTHQSSTLYYLLGDHLGSTAITLTSTGALESEVRYKAWGEDRYSSGPDHTSYRYTGQRNEASLGIYYYGARWYDSYLNRWIQPDTIVPLASQGVQAFDRYAYVSNNPLRYTDPSGHWISGDQYDLAGAENPIEEAEYLRATSQLRDPSQISGWEEIKDDPADLLARAILSEEGNKLLTDDWSDAVGVAWVIRNRHDNWYASKGAKPPYSGVHPDDRWLEAATEGILAMENNGQIGFAVNIQNYWGYYGNSQDEAIFAYNIAYQIALDVLSADPSQDPTRGADSYADAYTADNGETVFWDRTRFYILERGYHDRWCMPDVVSCK